LANKKLKTLPGITLKINVFYPIKHKKKWFHGASPSGGWLWVIQNAGGEIPVEINLLK
jgi:hypothetical protein